MFGFGRVDGLNKREYRERVKNLLENRIGIDTNSASNIFFPGALAFLELIDHGWNAKRPPEDNALYIGIAYWRGCVKFGGQALIEAKRIDEDLTSFIREAGLTGKISEQRARSFVMDYDEYSWMLSNGS